MAPFAQWTRPEVLIRGGRIARRIIQEECASGSTENAPIKADFCFHSLGGHHANEKRTLERIGGAAGECDKAFCVVGVPMIGMDKVEVFLKMK